MRIVSYRFRRALIAASTGVLLSLAFAPVQFAPIAFVALIPLFMMLNYGGSFRRAFLDGWLAGFIFFLLTASWILPFGWLPWILLSAIEALCFGAIAVLYSYQFCFCRVLGVPALWVLLEMLRSTFPLGGFGWARIGESVAGSFGPIGMASWFGTWGTGLIIVMINVQLTSILSLYIDRFNMHVLEAAHIKNHVEQPEAPADWSQIESNKLVPMPTPAVYDDAQMFRNSDISDMDLSSSSGNIPTCCRFGPENTPRRLSSFELLQAMPTVVGLLGIALVMVFASQFFPYVIPATQDVALVGVVQAGDVRKTHVAGVSSFSNVVMRKAYDMQYQATRTLRNDYLDFIVWPENGVDANLAEPESTHARSAVVSSMQLVRGAPIVTGEWGQEGNDLFNRLTVYTLDKENDLVRGDFIAKKHLVPFGEWFPFEQYLRPILDIPLYGHFTPGNGPGLLNVAGFKMGGVICYESGYPSLFSQALDEGSEAIIVATNNSSFGETSMSQQHLLMSRFRAVEFGRDVIHASISGQSAIIRSDGTIIKPTKQFEPAAIHSGVYMRQGMTAGYWVNQYVWILAVLLLGFSLIRTTIIRRNRSERLLRFVKAYNLVSDFSALQAAQHQDNENE